MGACALARVWWPPSPVGWLLVYIRRAYVNSCLASSGRSDRLNEEVCCHWTLRMRTWGSPARRPARSTLIANQRFFAVSVVLSLMHVLTLLVSKDP